MGRDEVGKAGEIERRGRVSVGSMRRGRVIRAEQGGVSGELGTASGELGGARARSGADRVERSTVEVSIDDVELMGEGEADPGQVPGDTPRGSSTEGSANPWDELAAHEEAVRTQVLEDPREAPRVSRRPLVSTEEQAREDEAPLVELEEIEELEELEEIPETTLQEEEIQAAQAPRPPKSLEETGLDEGFLLDLTLKHVYFGGELEAIQVSDRLAVAFPVAEELLYRLKRQELVVAQGGSGVLRGMRLRHRATELGRKRVEDVLRRDAYCDVAPVPYEQYGGQVALQTVRGVHVSPDRLRAALAHLVLPDHVSDRLGPALHSGHAIFLHGPPGNGKTAIAQALGEAVPGHVFVPRNVRVGHEILRVYDPLVHTPVPGEHEHDPRWVLCERPRVVVGGELTLDMLEVTPSGAIGVHEAPLQVKANGGVMVVDDFGRQRCDPQVLLNRWIVPLESGVDYLTFNSGLKVRVPFDALVVFATNLDPADLVDEAFFRRIRYKVRIDSPEEAAYQAIWAQVCERMALPYDEQQVNAFLGRHYRARRRPLRACHPRDLLEQIRDMEQYLGARPTFDAALLDQLAAAYFGEAPSQGASSPSRGSFKASGSKASGSKASGSKASGSKASGSKASGSKL